MKLGPQLSRQDYRIGWICALSKELTASIAMLDEQHEAVLQDASDDNSYTLGRIGDYNVVMACLPQGEIGNHLATSVATYMRTTFPNMDVGFMVGIGGGVPSAEHDIRLGDVVVSVPTNTYGGVVQYDHGKSVLDNGWTHSGHMNSPPFVLKTTISKLESLHRINGHKIHDFLEQMFEEHPHLYPDFARDQKPEDILFQPQPEGHGDSDWIKVEREDRPSNKLIVVHYGLIGSGNQVIKDARTRDAISKRHGGILCFEMEAAGLMNNFPCVVIRGICDYADAFKHKKWQEHAAAVAAAYTKEVVLALPKSLRYKKRTSSDHSPERDRGSTSWSDTSYEMLEAPGKHPDIPMTTTGAFLLQYPRNESFVGREDILSTLDEKLNARDHCPRVSLFGLGGVGKTQTAIELAHRTYQKAPECCIFWVSAATAEAFENDYREIGEMLQIPGISDGSADVKKLVYDALSADILGRWLLIVDNSDDEQVFFRQDYGDKKQWALRDYLPSSRSGAILFTTRTRQIAVRQAGKNVVRMESMDKADSESILRRSLLCEDVADDAEAVASLISLLHGLPLALMQAAAYINKNDVTVGEYVGFLQNSEQSTLAMLSEDFEDSISDRRKQTSIAATWLISFEQIKRQSSLAIEYLSFLATVKNQSVAQSALPPGETPTALVEAVGLLTGYCFVSRHHKKKTLTFHRLVYLAMRNWLWKEGTFRAQMKNSASRLADIIPLGGNKDRDVWSAHLPHAVHILESSDIDWPFALYQSLAGRCGRCYYSLGNYAVAAKIQSDMLSLTKSLRGPRDPATLTCTASYAESLSHQGKLEQAASLHRDVLKIRQETLPLTDPSIGESLQYLAETLARQGQYSEAEAMHRQALDFRKRHLGPQHRSTLNSMSYLAEALRQLGSFSEAESMHRQVLNMRMDILGETYNATMASMSCLGLALRDLERFDEAEELQRRVFGIRLRVLGPDHPHSLISKRWLADILKHQRNFAESLKLHKEVLESQTDIHGPKHPDTLLTMHSLAETLMHQGKLKEARSMHEQVFLLRSEALCPQHPDTLVSMKRFHETLAQLDHRQGATLPDDNTFGFELLTHEDVDSSTDKNVK